jgi:hypothetical protein
VWQIFAGSRMLTASVETREGVPVVGKLHVSQPWFATCKPAVDLRCGDACFRVLAMLDVILRKVG